MRDLTHEELTQIHAGCGNNGWGNGEDPTNPGSFSGATAPSKSINGSDPSAGKINVNPTDSDGR